MDAASAEVYARAVRRLARRDPVLKRLTAAVGQCTLAPNPDGLRVLVRSVVAQLISTKAAHVIAGRVEAAAGPIELSAAGLLKLGEEGLRACGLTRNKARGLTDLAARVQDGRLPLDSLPGMSDEEVIARLVPVYGIGTWTAEMFLIFCLGRLDVLPVDDLGLRAGVKEQYGLAEMPTKGELRARAEAWRPYRTVATWYFWRSRGFVPQSS